MTITRVEMIQHAKTGLAADDVVNVWHFMATGAVVDADRSQLIDDITNFYFTDGAGVANQRISYFLSPVLQSGAGATELKLYEFAEGATSAGSPVMTVPKGSDAGTVGGTPLPDQTSVVWSFRGDYGTRPEITPIAPVGPKGDMHLRARVRGRIYLGPLNSHAIDSAGSRALVAPAFIAAIENQAGVFTQAIKDHGKYQFGVYSKVEGAFAQATKMWVDNRFDVQRRRAELATARTSTGLVV